MTEQPTSRNEHLTTSLSALKVKVYPYRENRAHGNIMWAERDRGPYYYRVSRFAANGGKFPKDHPIAPGSVVFGQDSQCGESPALAAFRSLGYWASCFPEGDGITWKPLNGQSDDQCLKDIQACFGLGIQWERT